MIVFLAGPIGHWWYDNWDSPAHWHYAKWRDAVSKGLVVDEHLVYRPHEGFKGAWDPKAQTVNDAAIKVCDVFLDLRPSGVPSPGTDDERDMAVEHGKLIIDFPPPEDMLKLHHVSAPRAELLRQNESHFDQAVTEFLIQLADIEHGLDLAVKTT